MDTIQTQAYRIYALLNQFSSIEVTEDNMLKCQGKFRPYMELEDILNILFSIDNETSWRFKLIRRGGIIEDAHGMTLLGIGAEQNTTKYFILAMQRLVLYYLENRPKNLKSTQIWNYEEKEEDVTVIGRKYGTSEYEICSDNYSDYERKFTVYKGKILMSRESDYLSVGEWDGENATFF